MSGAFCHGAADQPALSYALQIFLVGTAHVSKASCEEVQSMIRAIEPQTVFVELDKARAWKLMHQQDKTEEQASLLL